jgi:ankyrin repeat protein
LLHEFQTTHFLLNHVNEQNKTGWPLNNFFTINLTNQLFGEGKPYSIQLAIENNGFGFSALSYAAHYDCLNLAKLLLKNDANVNRMDQKENTPLHYACHGNNIEMIKLLLENEANINLKNYENMKPKEIATMRKNQEILNILSKYENNVFTKNYSKPNSNNKTYAVVHSEKEKSSKKHLKLKIQTKKKNLSIKPIRTRKKHRI